MVQAEGARLAQHHRQRRRQARALLVVVAVVVPPLVLALGLRAQAGPCSATTTCVMTSRSSSTQVLTPATTGFASLGARG